MKLLLQRACQELNNWNIRNVYNMRYMFNGANSFSQSLSNWNISNVKIMDGIFLNTYFFDESIKQWNTNKVLKIHVNKIYSFNKTYINKVIIHQIIKENDINLIKNNHILLLPTEIILYILNFTTIKELLLFSNLSLDFPNHTLWKNFAVANNIPPPKKKGRKYKTWKDVVLKKKENICANCFQYLGSELLNIKFYNLNV